MKRALTVGIDQYVGAELRGCSSDAERMADVLARNEDGSPNFDTRVLTAPVGARTNTITRAVLRENLEELFSSPASIALLQYSGHGTANNLDGYLVTQDATRYDEGVSMSDVLKLANDSEAEEVVIFLDCCHSGAMGNPPAIDNTRSLLREGVSILSASRADEPSVETAGGGVFTSLVVSALEGGAADLLGAVSAPGIYAYVEAALGAWDQRPLFKACVSRVLPLRFCAPPIEAGILRNLPTLFPLPAEDLALDPTFEQTSSSANVARVDTFCQLQALNRVHLVMPVGADHMYDAAMQGKACRLTPSGLYYWRLANDCRI
jgi:hypothetical protein